METTKKASRRSIILSMLRENKSDDEIIKEIQKSFPEADVKKVKNQISGNRSYVQKEKTE